MNGEAPASTLTKRELFAALAMIGILAHPEHQKGNADMDERDASDAFDAADALIDIFKIMDEARAREKEDDNIFSQPTCLGCGGDGRNHDPIWEGQPVSPSYCQECGGRGRIPNARRD